MNNPTTRGPVFWLSLWFVVLTACLGTIVLMARARVDLTRPGMAISISTFGLLVATFVVWLSVRILNRKEKWALWTAAALPIPLYVLGVLPIVWLGQKKLVPSSADSFVELFYSPLIWLINDEVASPFLVGFWFLVSVSALIISVVWSKRHSATGD